MKIIECISSSFASFFPIVHFLLDTDATRYIYVTGCAIDTFILIYS